MKGKLAGLAGLLSILLVEMHPAPAEACGVKLTIKTSAPRKAVPRTSRPSHVLLVGTPPRRLERDLSAAGHDVETASTTSAAKRESYAVVIVDSTDQATEAKQKYPEATIVVRSGDVGADLRSVEDRVARRPVRADEGRTVVARREDRAPIAVGPDKPAVRTAVAAKEPTETPVAVTPTPTPTPPPAPTPTPTPTPTPPPERISTAARVEETPPAHKEPKVAPAPKATSAELHEEVYFTVGSATLGNKARLQKAVKWLTANSDVKVTVEGHADPTGSADANMALSQSRAEAARDFLVSMGIDSSRIDVVPYGDTHIKYGRSDGRNRRVAIEAKK